jgi:WD40 repeat protein
MHILRGHFSPVLSLAYSPNGFELASGGADGFVLIWSAMIGRERLARQDHPSRMACLVYSPDGRTLASGERDRVALRDSTDARMLKRHERARHHFSIHAHSVNDLAFTPGGQFVVSGGGDRQGGEAVIWDPDAERYLVLIGAGAIRGVGCDAGGESMAFGTETHLLITPGLRGEVFSAWANASDEYLEDEVIRMNFREIRRFELERPARTRALAFAPDGRTLASASGGVVTLWDPAEGRLRTTLSGHDDEVCALAFAPDGRTLASSSLDGTVRLWDAVEGRQRASYDWEIGPVHCVAFAPDGMTMAAGGDSGIVVWDVDETS